MHALPSNPSITSNVPITVGFVAAVGVVSMASVSLAVATVLVIATVAALIDIRQGRVPDELVLLALLPAAVTLLAGDVPPGDVALGIAVFAGPLFVIHMLSPRSMGFGDVKLAVPLGAALGAVDPALGLIALCVGSATTAAIGLTNRRPALPFAPGLVAGTLAALVLSIVSSTDWLLSWR